MPSLVYVSPQDSPQDSPRTRHHVGKNSIMYMKSESKSTYAYGQTLSDDNATWMRQTLKAKYRFRKAEKKWRKSRQARDYEMYREI